MQTHEGKATLMARQDCVNYCVDKKKVVPYIPMGDDLKCIQQLDHFDRNELTWLGVQQNKQFFKDGFRDVIFNLPVPTLKGVEVLDFNASKCAVFHTKGNRDVYRMVDCNHMAQCVCADYVKYMSKW